ncbi:MAG: peptide deformylase [Anaerolineales bacterium]
MSIREIITVPHPTLRRKARPVTQFNDDLQTLIEDMIETMRAAPGVGLAAPQVNVSLQVIVVEYGDDNDENVPPRLYVMVNPEITRFSRDTEIGTEGCLSIPGLLGEVERPIGITVKGQNRYGQPLKLKLNGWVARIFQHEIDHLNGVLFTDKALEVFKPGELAEQSVPAD